MTILKSDVAVIGGGIVGTAIARELSKYQLDVVLLEKEPDIAMGTTKANSAILHAGFDAHPGSLKARLNVRGNAMYHQLKDELALEIKWTGSLVVATSDDEMNTVQELFERGKTNGVPGLAILNREEVLAKEPKLSSGVKGALWAPSAGIFLPFGAAIAFAENAVKNGVKVLTECPVTGIEVTDGHVTGVKTSQGMIATQFVINAAGLYADDVSGLANDNSFTISPRKGEYILFDKNAGSIISNIIFPVPSKKSKGILLCPTVHGNIFIGPNAQDISDKDDLATTPAGLNEVIIGAKRLMPALPLNASITEFAGLRAAANEGDFVIRPSEVTAGLIHAAGIQSPGLTSAPAIAEFVVNILRECGLALTPKPNFLATNEAKVVFRDLTDEQKQVLISKNSLYGRVICRCETITEGEILDAIHSPCGAKTVDGVKRRTRAGMGRCQGGFCGPKITAILARELSVPIADIRKEKAESYLFYDKISGNCEVTDHD
ncbi:fad dependent oxidoreductase [Lucifera butyrica]|uniref:Fad dependent oxidoreductase n=1 Tax=Lucifera butyrica TaxID=1351585 RepID=A0A498RJI8_9FIRM|nr:NAD(P)/FAD-dependent oxidoreductase [Lucifera butyrica]VBB09188.1 fad dependent oxidoreductase [Lucifera butyrica]